MATLSDKEMNQLLGASQTQQVTQRRSALQNALAQGARIAEVLGQQQQQAQPAEFRRRAPAFMYAGLDPAIQQQMSQQNLSQNELAAQKQAEARRIALQEEQNEMAREAQRQALQQAEEERALRLKEIKSRMENDRLERELREQLQEQGIEADRAQAILEGRISQEIQQDRLEQQSQDRMAQIAAEGQERRKTLQTEFNLDKQLMEMDSVVGERGLSETEKNQYQLLRNKFETIGRSLEKQLEEEKDLPAPEPGEERSPLAQATTNRKEQLLAEYMKVANQLSKLTRVDPADLVDLSLVPNEVRESVAKGLPYSSGGGEVRTTSGGTPFTITIGGLSPRENN